MKRNIEDAVKLYSGDRPMGLFADHLPDNIGAHEFDWPGYGGTVPECRYCGTGPAPEETEIKAKFAKLFREFSTYYQAAQIQGFVGRKRSITRFRRMERVIETIPVSCQRILMRFSIRRYRELRKAGGGWRK